MSQCPLFYSFLHPPFTHPTPPSFPHSPALSSPFPPRFPSPRLSLVIPASPGPCHPRADSGVLFWPAVWCQFSHLMAHSFLLFYVSSHRPPPCLCLNRNSSCLPTCKETMPFPTIRELCPTQQHMCISEVFLLPLTRFFLIWRRSGANPKNQKAPQ